MLSLRKLFAHNTSSKIKYENYAGYKYPAKLTVNSPHPMICKITPLCSFTDHYRFMTVVHNSFGTEVGKHNYFMNNDTLHGLKIYTNDSNRHQGIGELMRLVTLIIMKENNLKEIKIKSLFSAIPFHRKYLFMPNFDQSYDYLKTVLENIKNKKQLPNKLRVEAGNLLQEDTTKQNFWDDLNKLIGKIIDLNMITKDLFPEINGYSHSSIPLKLDYETVERNKNFFNSLFKKHGIDYEI